MSSRAKPRAGASAPKGTRKPRKKNQQGGKRAVASNSGRALASAARFQQTSMPTSVGVVIRNPVFTRFGSAPYNENAGDYGLRLEFVLPWSTVLKQTAGSGSLGGNSVSSTSANNFGYVSPTEVVTTNTPGFTIPWIGIPQAFTFYRFRKFMLRYVTEDQTGEAGTMVLAFVPDGNATTYQGGNAGSNREISKSVEFPLWATQVELDCIEDKRMDDNEAKLFYCAQSNSATDANLRIANQGQCFCSPTLNYAAVAQCGMLYAVGVVDLYSPAANTQVGFRSAEERKAKCDEPLPLAPLRSVLALTSSEIQLSRVAAAVKAEGLVPPSPPLTICADSDYLLVAEQSSRSVKADISERKAPAPALLRR